jgi:hypothetical protein
MRYITATVGAVLIFIAIIIVGFGVMMFLPPALVQPIAVPLGPISFSAPPSLLIAIAIAPMAALHSFRSTLKRDKEKSEADPSHELPSN